MSKSMYNAVCPYFGWVTPAMAATLFIGFNGIYGDREAVDCLYVDDMEKRTGRRWRVHPRTLQALLKRGMMRETFWWGEGAREDMPSYRLTNCGFYYMSLLEEIIFRRAAEAGIDASEWFLASFFDKRLPGYEVGLESLREANRRWRMRRLEVNPRKRIIYERRLGA